MIAFLQQMLMQRAGVIHVLMDPSMMAGHQQETQQLLIACQQLHSQLDASVSIPKILIFSDFGDTQSLWVNLTFGDVPKNVPNARCIWVQSKDTQIWVFTTAANSSAKSSLNHPPSAGSDLFKTPPLIFNNLQACSVRQIPSIGF